MKTGIIQADPRRTCWKDYLYHGIWCRCRVACQPEPFILEPTEPPPPPRLFSYEADVFPNLNPQPYTRYVFKNRTIKSIKNGAYVIETTSYASRSHYVWWYGVGGTFWAKKMTYIAYGMPWGLPTGHGGVGSQANSDFSLYMPLGKVRNIMSWWQLIWNGTGWVTGNQETQIQYISGTVVIIPYTQVPFVVYTYDEVLDRTAINYCDADSDFVAGKVYPSPQFRLEVFGYPWSSALDYQRIVDLS